MKKLFFTIIFAVLSFISASAQKIELEKVIIDKDNCTITRKSDGKVFNLYGNVKIVDFFEDFRVKIVTSWEDARIKFRDCSTNSCCEFHEVDSFYDMRIKIVDSFEDFRIQIVGSFPGITHQ
ncbi:MAG: hypothetical protein J6T60_10700 [Bacteroidales bacterium]|nr:hypothetical protein [Bacteroidales bacterium]